MRSRRLLRAGGALSLVVALGGGALLLATPACQDRTCEGIALDYGRKPNEGALIDQDTWETTPAEGKWLPYPARRTWYIYPNGLQRRKIARVSVYVSAQEEPNVLQPNDPFGVRNQYTTAAGNVGVVTHFPDPGDVLNPAIKVKNDTCGEFFVRVVLEAYPVGTEPSVDAGADAADAADGDAKDAEGPSDANTDVNDGASE